MGLLDRLELRKLYDPIALGKVACSRFRARKLTERFHAMSVSFTDGSVYGIHGNDR